MKRVMTLVILLIASSFINAKDKRARSSEKLRSMLAQAPYSLVLFFDKSRENMKDKQLRQKIVNLEKMFRSLSRDSYYKDAQLQFIRADVARGDISTAAKRHNIKIMPSFAIFLGRDLKTVLPGFAYRDRIENFIESNLKAKMNDAIKQADELREKRLEEAKIRAYNRSFWYPYWGGGWGPYWYGPYWYGGGYPYWRYGYRRPYGGFYFGW